MRPALTARQQEILDFICTFFQERGRPPTIHEIQQAFGFRSTNAVWEHLHRLKRKGYLQSAPGGKFELPPDLRQGKAPIPILGEVPAGPTVEAWELSEGSLLEKLLENAPEGTFALRVHGESMKDMGLWEGDYVLVLPTREVTSGDVVVARLNGEVTLKRFLREDGRVCLCPENPEMSPIRVSEDDDFQVIGRVVGALRLF